MKIQLKYSEVQQFIDIIKNFPIRIDKRKFDTRRLLYIIQEFNALDKNCSNKSLRLSITSETEKENEASA